MHQIARIDLPQSHAAVEWRYDVAVTEVELGGLDRRIITLQCGGRTARPASFACPPAGGRQNPVASGKSSAEGQVWHWRAAPRPEPSLRWPDPAPPDTGEDQSPRARCPALPACPSATGTCINVPSTRARTVTVLRAWTVPSPLSQTGTSWRSALATLTGIALPDARGAGCALAGGGGARMALITNNTRLRPPKIEMRSRPAPAVVSTRLRPNKPRPSQPRQPAAEPFIGTTFPKLGIFREISVNRQHQLWPEQP